MKVSIVLTVMLELASCAPQSSQPSLNVSQADIAQCRYEAQTAYALAPERNIGQMIDKAAGQSALQRSCLESRSVTHTEVSNNADYDRRDGASRACKEAGIEPDDARYSKCFYAVLAGGSVPQTSGSTSQPAGERLVKRTAMAGPQLSRSEAADVCVSRGNARGSSAFDACLHGILDHAYGPGI